jgi:hypothetical protein
LGSVSITISDSTFDTIKGTSGGLIYIEENAAGSIGLTMTSSTVTKVSATSGWGGMLYAPSSSVNNIVVLDTSSITISSAAFSGGVFGMYGYGAQSITMTDSSIAGSVAGDVGGVASIYGTTNTFSMDATSSITTSQGTEGGCIYFGGYGAASFTATGATISGCSATTGNGGMLYSNSPT